MIKKKLCGLFVAVTFLFNFTFITENVQASSIVPNETQVFVKNSISSNNSAIAHLQNNSFNPLNASDKELILHGYPTRPKTKKDLTNWKKAVSVKLIKPEIARTSMLGHNDESYKKTSLGSNIKSPLLNNKKSTQNTSVDYSRNWAGYEVDTNVTGAESSWEVPSVAAVPYVTTPAYSSQWTGIGGGSINPNTSLIQAGNAAQVLANGSTNYYLWFELYNTSYEDGYPMEFTNLSCKPGDNIYTSVQTVSSSGSTAIFEFFIANTTTGYGVSTDVKIDDNNNSNECAEWISENNLTTYNPKTVTQNNALVAFWAAEYQTSIGGSFTGITNSTSNLVGDIMYNGSSSGSIPVTYNLLSSPTDLSGSSFDINWHNYY